MTALIACDYDVFALTETWLTGDILDSELQIPGFNIYRCDKQSDSAPRHGVLVGVKTCINHAHVQVTLNSRIETVAFSLSGSTGTFVILAAFSPPMTSDYRWSHSNWCEFPDCMEHHGKLHPFFVLGDMNLPQTDWSSYSSPTLMNRKYWTSSINAICFNW